MTTTTTTTTFTINNTGWGTVLLVFGFAFAVAIGFAGRAVRRLRSGRNPAALGYAGCAVLAVVVPIMISHRESPRTATFEPTELILGYHWSTARVPYAAVRKVSYNVRAGRRGTEDHVLQVEADGGPHRLWTNSRRPDEVAGLQAAYAEVQKRTGLPAGATK